MLRGAFRAADFHTSVKRLSSTFCFSLIIYKDSSTEARAVSVAKPLRVPRTTASDFLKFLEPQPRKANPQNTVAPIGLSYWRYSVFGISAKRQGASRKSRPLSFSRLSSFFREDALRGAFRAADFYLHERRTCVLRLLAFSIITQVLRPKPAQLPQPKRRSFQ